MKFFIMIVLRLITQLEKGLCVQKYKGMLSIALEDHTVNCNSRNNENKNNLKHLESLFMKQNP